MGAHHTVGRVERCLNLHLRPELAESWDNVGLLVGDRRRAVRRMMLCIDLTEPVLREAQSRRADFVLAYHPPIFDPLKAVLADRQSVIYRAVRAQIAVYAIHTAYDMIDGGTSDALADVIGLEERTPIRPNIRTDHSKVVVFVPKEHVDHVASAAFEAGAGVIGDYSHCSFRTGGHGTFLGGETTNPTRGQAGRFEVAREVRLEVLVPNTKRADVVRRIKDAHPYEEVALDVYPLTQISDDTGLGRSGRLSRPANLRSVATRIKRRTGLKTVLTVSAHPDRTLKTAAVCPGSCGKLAVELAGKVDLYVTGELRHHDALALQTRGTNAICLGHGNSERPALKALGEMLQPALSGVTIFPSDRDIDPLQPV